NNSPTMPAPTQENPPPAQAPTSRASRRTFAIVIALLLIVAAGALAWYSFATPRATAETASTSPAPGGASGPGGRRGGADASRPTPVATMAARSGDFDVYLN